MISWRQKEMTSVLFLMTSNLRAVTSEQQTVIFGPGPVKISGQLTVISVRKAETSGQLTVISVLRAVTSEQQTVIFGPEPVRISGQLIVIAEWLTAL